MLKGKNEKAREVLTKLANEDEAKIVLAEIDASLKETARQAVLLRRPACSFVGIMLSRVPAARRHQRGAVLRPADVRRTWASRANASFAQTVIMGIVMVVFTLVATVTVDKWGRKPLLILGAIIMAVSMTALGFMFYAGYVGLARPGRGLHLHRGFLAVLGPGGVGDARGDLPELHPRQGHGHCRRRAVVHELGRVTVTFNIMDGNYGAHCRVQPRLRLLAVRRLQRAGGRCSSGSTSRRARASRSRTCTKLWHVEDNGLSRCNP